MLENEIAASLARIEQKVDQIKTAGDDHEERLRVLEGRSGGKWDAVVRASVTALVSAIAGLLVGKIIP